MGVTILITLLMSLLVLSMAANLILVWLWNRANAQWMRIFSYKLEMPLASMEHGDKPKPEVVAPVEPHKRKISIPIPGVDWMRQKANGQ